MENAETRLALFDFAFDHAPIGIALVDLKGRILRGNKVFSKMVGIPVPEVIGTHFREFTHPDDLEADLALFNEVLAGDRDGYTVEKRYIHPDGKLVHVLIHVAAMRDAKGKVVRFISQIEDITEKKANERELAERAAQLALAMEALRGGFWHMDIASKTFQTSEGLAQFIAGPDSEPLDLKRYLSRVNVADISSADLSPLVEGKVDQSVAEYRLDTIAGERWMRCDRRLLRDSDGTPLRIVGMAIDFTAEHDKIERLQKYSELDALTGLLNRRGLERRFAGIKSSTGYSVLAMDLDGFKQVNDRYGHTAGDEVLIETARRLSEVIRDGDLACRTGGDEFVIVIPGEHRSGEAVGHRIVRAMREPIVLEEGKARVRASLGGTWTAAKADLKKLITEADEVLYKVKAAGKDNAEFKPR